ISCTIRPPPGTSIGPFMTLAPFFVALPSAASRSGVSCNKATLAALAGQQIRIIFDFRHPLAQSGPPNLRVETMLNRRGSAMEPAASHADMVGAFTSDVLTGFLGAFRKCTTDEYGHELLLREHRTGLCPVFQQHLSW